MLDLIMDAAGALGDAAERGLRDAAGAIGKIGAGVSWLAQVAEAGAAAWARADIGAARRGLRACAGAEARLLAVDMPAGVRGAAGSIGAPLQRAMSMADALGGVRSAATAISTDVLHGRAGGGLALPAEAVGGRAHLLVMTPADGSPSFYFNISTASFSEFKRSINFGISKQERLTRDSAVQGVNRGGETYSLSGLIFPEFMGAGSFQVDALIDMGRTLRPVTLTSGDGENLGKWMISKVGCAYSILMPNGRARRQAWDMELERYGDDLQNV